MTVDTAFQRLREANPAPEPDLLLGEGLELAALLEASELRSTEMQTQEPITAAPKSRPPRRNLILAMAAIAIAVVVGLVVLLPNDEADIADGTEPITPTTVAAVEEPAPPAAEPTAVADAYFAAFNSGDEEAVLALFDPDIAIDDSIAGDWTVGEWENLLAWNVAQGTIHEEVTCNASDDGSVACSTDNRDVLVQASNDVGVPTTIRFEVENGLITTLSFSYGQPDFTRVSVPFEAYVEAQHGASDEATRAVEGWHDTDVAESRRNGAARAALAAQWADWGVAVMDAFEIAFNAQDAEAFFALLTSGDSWGPDAPNRESYARLLGTEAVQESSNCRPAGVFGEALQVTCDQVVTDAYGGRSGSVVDGTFTIRVRPDGLIREITDQWNGPAIIRFHEDFITWLATTYPEVHASTTWDAILPGVGDYERMIPYIDEFVAQSEVYPFSG